MGAEYFDKHYGSGAKGYTKASKNYFDKKSFVDGGRSKYINPRLNTDYQGKGHPIYGVRFSFWDIGVPLLSPAVVFGLLF